jgi:acyl carrier protein
MNIKETIREFVLNNFLKGDRSRKLVDDTSFIEEGIIDSIGVLELVAFLEETFGFRVEDEELIPENLNSIARLVTYVESKSAVKKV